MVDAGATVWLLASTLVGLLSPIGLAVYNAGLLPVTSSINVVMMVWVGGAAVTVLWYVVGFSLCFGSDQVGVIGDPSEFPAFVDVRWDEAAPEAPQVPALAFAAYQLALAVTAPLLLVGSAAERVPFRGFLWLVLAWSLCVYFPVCHSVWAENGVLEKLGVVDFAGGIVVHLAGGVSALALSVMLPKRPVFHQREPHNVPLAAVGCALFVVGQTALICGGAAVQDGSAVEALLGSVMCVTVSGLVWTALSWQTRGAPSLVHVLHGSLAGVAAAAGCAGFVHSQTSAVAGLVAGLASFTAARLVEFSLQFDDGLHVSSIHGMGGVVGAVAVGLGADDALTGGLGDVPEGLLYEDNGFQVAYQFISAVVVAVFASIATCFVAWQLNKHEMLSRPSFLVTPNRVDHGEVPYVIQLYKGANREVVAARAATLSGEEAQEELRAPTIPGPAATLVSPHQPPASAPPAAVDGPPVETAADREAAEAAAARKRKQRVAPAPPVRSPSKKHPGPPLGTAMQPGAWDA